MAIASENRFELSVHSTPKFLKFVAPKIDAIVAEKNANKATVMRDILFEKFGYVTDESYLVQRRQNASKVSHFTTITVDKAFYVMLCQEAEKQAVSPSTLAREIITESVLRRA